jgi:hypothetical protein
MGQIKDGCSFISGTLCVSCTVPVLRPTKGQVGLYLVSSANAIVWKDLADLILGLPAAKFFGDPCEHA